jgi:hypothetical protein
MSHFSVLDALVPTNFRDAVVPPLAPGFKGTSPLDLISPRQQAAPVVVQSAAAASDTDASAPAAGRSMLTQRAAAASATDTAQRKTLLGA